MSRRHGSATIAAILLAALAACGVPRDTTPRRIADEAVPFGLLSGPATTATTAAEGTGIADVFFLANGRLSPVKRSVEAPPRAASLLQDLVAGPTREEAVAGLETAIGGQIELRDVTVNAGVAAVDLSSSFGSLEGASQVEAVAQIVFTATAVPDVSAVRFLVEGQRVDVPKGDGTLSAGAVGRADFPGLAPP